MKRLIVCLIFSSKVFTQDLSIGIGLNGWYNDWKSFWNKSDNLALLIGPEITIRLKNFSSRLSYLFPAGKYRWEEIGYGGLVIIEGQGEKEELDIEVGYMFIPHVELFGGYKQFSIDSKSSYDKEIVEIINIIGQCPVVGIKVKEELPVRDKAVALFVNVGYLFGRSERKYKFIIRNIKYSEEESEGEEARGITVEVGLNYAIGKSSSVNVGYKYQNFEGKERSRETFSGFTLGLFFNYGSDNSFRRWKNLKKVNPLGGI